MKPIYSKSDYTFGYVPAADAERERRVGISFRALHSCEHSYLILERRCFLDADDGDEDEPALGLGDRPPELRTVGNPDVAVRAAVEAAIEWEVAVTNALEDAGGETFEVRRHAGRPAETKS